jgi:lactoylglutathione lyase
MRYLHTMIRVLDLDQALRFWRDQLGLQVLRRSDHPQGRFSLVFLGTGAPGDPAQLELTWNWDQDQPYTEGRNFGHVAFAVDDIYATCARLQAEGVVILRPPRDGRMAFIRSPDGISVELLQAGEALPPAAPWADLPNQGTW